MQWYVKYGYFAASTAYLVANVSAWIRLFQRDVVFLRFGKRSATAQFFHLVESLKARVSRPPSILWYHYFNGIGDRLIENGAPISIATFSCKLATDDHFRAYYDQLFQFVRHLPAQDYKKLIEDTLHILRQIKKCLEENGAVPVSRSDSPYKDPLVEGELPG